MSHSDTRRCGECEALLMDEGYLCEDCHSDYMGWLMEQDYRRGHGAGPYTVTDRLRWLRRSVPSWSMLEALEELIRSASLHGHILCTSDGHPIPESSYRRRKGGL